MIKPNSQVTDLNSNSNLDLLKKSIGYKYKPLIPKSIQLNGLSSAMTVKERALRQLLLEQVSGKA